MVVSVFLYNDNDISTKLKEHNVYLIFFWLSVCVWVVVACEKATVDLIIEIKAKTILTCVLCFDSGRGVLISSVHK